jgi:hypothetical protein
MPRNFLKFCKIQRKYLLFVIWRGSIGTKGFDTQRNPKKMLKNKKPKMDFLTLLEATPGFEPGIRVLQTRALPLGYVAICIWSERRDSNPRHQPWQGCTLPTELLSHKLLIIIANLSQKVNILHLKIGKNNLLFLSFLSLFLLQYLLFV